VELVSKVCEGGLSLDVLTLEIELIVLGDFLLKHTTHGEVGQSVKVTL
jgi:hypothetical protein